MKNKKNLNEDLNEIKKIYFLSDFGFKKDEKCGSEKAYALSIRVHNQNSRQGTLGCKTRRDLISRSNKKPWRQKGTGRARAGTPRSPLWRGGAVSHPPMMRTRKLYINKSVNNSAFKYLINLKFEQKNIFSLNWEAKNKSTNLAFEMLKKNNIHKEKILLFYQIYDYETFFSFSNLKNVKLVSYDAVGTFSIGTNSSLVFFEKDKNLFKEMVEKWMI